MDKLKKIEMSYEEIGKRIIKTRENSSPRHIPNLFKSMTGLNDCSSHVDLLSMAFKNDSECELGEFVLYETNLLDGKTRVLNSLLFLSGELVAMIFRKDIRELTLYIVIPSEETEVCYEVYWFGVDKYKKTLDYFAEFSRSSCSKRKILSSTIDENKIINIEDSIFVDFKLIHYNQITKRTNIYYKDSKVKEVYKSDKGDSVVITTDGINKKEVKMKELSCFINIK